MIEKIKKNLASLKWWALVMSFFGLWHGKLTGGDYALIVIGCVGARAYQQGKYNEVNKTNA